MEALGDSFGQLGCKNELKDGEEEAKEAKDQATTQRKTPRGAIRGQVGASWAVLGAPWSSKVGESAINLPSALRAGAPGRSPP